MASISRATRLLASHMVHIGDSLSAGEFAQLSATCTANRAAASLHVANRRIACTLRGHSRAPPSVAAEHVGCNIEDAEQEMKTQYEQWLVLQTEAAAQRQADQQESEWLEWVDWITGHGVADQGYPATEGLSAHRAKRARYLAPERLDSSSALAFLESGSAAFAEEPPVNSRSSETVVSNKNWQLDVQWACAAGKALAGTEEHGAEGAVTDNNPADAQLGLAFSFALLNNRHESCSGGDGGMETQQTHNSKMLETVAHMDFAAKVPSGRSFPAPKSFVQKDLPLQASLSLLPSRATQTRINSTCLDNCVVDDEKTTLQPISTV